MGISRGDHDYHYFAEVRGAITNLVAEDAANRTGVAEPFPIDLDHEYGGDGVRRGSYTFREFSCPTGGAGGLLRSRNHPHGAADGQPPGRASRRRVEEPGHPDRPQRQRAAVSERDTVHRRSDLRREP